MCVICQEVEETEERCRGYTDKEETVSGRKILQYHYFICDRFWKINYSIHRTMRTTLK